MILIGIRYQLKVFEVKNTWYTKVSISISTQLMNLNMEIQFNRSWLNMRLQKISLKISQSQNHKPQDELPLNPSFPLCFSPCLLLINHVVIICFDHLFRFSLFIKATYFDPNFSPFGIKSPKKALQNNIAQREKLVVQGVSFMNPDPIV